ncbi:hypothetical protein [Streptomyces sp. NPDC056255]|uniref:hypothetical protein n=1 Tax=Streptomyces sp. NPDC056255 TaxID=3345764 RepID=UPI0035DD79E4
MHPHENLPPQTAGPTPASSSCEGTDSHEKYPRFKRVAGVILCWWTYLFPANWAQLNESPARLCEK